MIRYSIRYSLCERAKTDGTHALRMRVSFNCQRATIFLPIYLPPENWDGVKAVNSKTWKSAASANIAIRDAQAAVDALFGRASNNNTMPTIADVRRAVVGTEGGTEERKKIAPILNDFIRRESVAGSWALKTTDKFVTLQHHLANANLVYLDQLTDQGIEHLTAYLLNTGMRNVSAAKMIRLTRWFLNWCIRNGITKDETFKRYTLRLKIRPRTVVYLQWDELLLFYHFDFGANTRLTNVRDVFCFCATTGLRWSDAAKLRWSDVHDDYIFVVTKKTSDTIRIDLNKYSRGILAKYSVMPHRPSDKVLPVVSTQNSNIYLKEAAMLCQLDSSVRMVYFRGAERIEEDLLMFEAITTHCARRTFVVNALRLGIPAEVVMKWTGHSDFRQLQPYVDIADDLRKREMSKFDEL